MVILKEKMISMMTIALTEKDQIEEYEEQDPTQKEENEIIKGSTNEWVNKKFAKKQSESHSEDVKEKDEEEKIDDQSGGKNQKEIKDNQNMVEKVTEGKDEEKWKKRSYSDY